MPDIQWMNLDPLKLMEELSQFTSLEGFKEMLDKAQVGHAYMNRPCLDPSDPDCPLSAPNKDLRQVGMVLFCLMNATQIPCQFQVLDLNLLLSRSESRYCCGTAGWLPWFLKEVYALAGRANPGGTDEELTGFFAEVRGEDGTL